VPYREPAKEEVAKVGGKSKGGSSSKEVTTGRTVRFQ